MPTSRFPENVAFIRVFCSKPTIWCAVLKLAPLTRHILSASDGPTDRVFIIMIWRIILCTQYYVGIYRGRPNPNIHGSHPRRAPPLDWFGSRENDPAPFIRPLFRPAAVCLPMAIRYTKKLFATQRPPPAFRRIAGVINQPNNPEPGAFTSPCP